jgi:hypothetical protein
MTGAKSKSGVIRKARRNLDYQTATALLAELGLSWEVAAARGRGHHMLVIEGRIRHPISTSPGPRTCPQQVRSTLLRRLRAAGIISETTPDGQDPRPHEAVPSARRMGG